MLILMPRMDCEHERTFVRTVLNLRLRQCGEEFSSADIETLFWEDAIQQLVRCGYNFCALLLDLAQRHQLDPRLLIDDTAREAGLPTELAIAAYETLYPIYRRGSRPPL